MSCSAPAVDAPSVEIGVEIHPSMN
jgi:hypothetical protein